MLLYDMGQSHHVGIAVAGSDGKESLLHPENSGIITKLLPAVCWSPMKNE